MRTSIFLFSLVFVFSCETEVKNVDSCGDSLIDPSEQCDGAELGGVTCENLGYYNKLGEVSCRPDCTLDLTACGNRCGDGTVETDHQEQCDGENLNSTSCVSLNFTNGGTLACTADCTFDTSACLTTCGNGNLETGEACDDGNEDPGDGCAADCSLEEGWICEGETISTCRPFCDPGLAYCAGECFDLANDPAHCGTCGHACGGGQLCAGSTCRLPEAAWEDAGSFASFMYNVRTTRYAISECPDGPFLWAIDTTAVPITHLMYKLGVAGEQWGPVDPPLDTGIVESYALDGGLAVACRGGVRVAAYSLGGGDTELAVRWLDTDAGLWKRFGDAALVSQCGGTDYLGMIVDSTDSLHVLSNGSGGCGFSVDYAWWDGSQWQAHPSMTNMPRQLTQNSAGNPSIATYGQTVYLGIAHHLELPILHTAHEVWTWQNDAWTQVGPDLDEGMGLNNGAENMSLAVSAAGRLCAAFVKTMEFVQSARLR
ncbi:MAG: hypothetical protein CVU65_12555, partial [Deltaproteobacteria bacterium HGW-Deltaproteobacteria-22]